MRTKKRKRLRISASDFILANRKASREEEILAHGKQVAFRRQAHKSKKRYDRNKLKKTITPTDDGFLFSGINPLTAKQSGYYCRARWEQKIFAIHRPRIVLLESCQEESSRLVNGKNAKCIVGEGLL
ncbi:MAG: hypothetical protein IJS30_03900 [Bacteroidales bacterium]|nr:hypothetical protein [Bacteroidales bacterium]